MPMDIGKAKDNFDKNGKPKCFNCNKYRYIEKDYKKLKKKKDTRKCYKYKQIGHIAKNCRLGQKIKNWSIQEETNKEDNEKSRVLEMVLSRHGIKNLCI